jgi:hypothetical protein
VVVSHKVIFVAIELFSFLNWSRTLESGNTIPI